MGFSESGDSIYYNTRKTSERHNRLHLQLLTAISEDLNASVYVSELTTAAGSLQNIFKISFLSRFKVRPPQIFKLLPLFPSALAWNAAECNGVRKTLHSLPCNGVSYDIVSFLIPNPNTLYRCSRLYQESMCMVWEGKVAISRTQRNILRYISSGIADGTRYWCNMSCFTMTGADSGDTSRDEDELRNRCD
jgi:hypothetical protein